MTIAKKVYVGKILEIVEGNSDQMASLREALENMTDNLDDCLAGYDARLVYQDLEHFIEISDAGDASADASQQTGAGAGQPDTRADETLTPNDARPEARGMRSSITTLKVLRDEFAEFARWAREYGGKCVRTQMNIHAGNYGKRDYIAATEHIEWDEELREDKITPRVKTRPVEGSEMIVFVDSPDGTR